MWSSRSEELGNPRGLRFTVELDGAAASYHDVLQGWQDNAAFRAIFNAWLADSTYSAFRWETPPVTSDTLKQPFEFVLLDSPWLACLPDPGAFMEHFKRSPEEDVLVFSNLGGDALMIVPRQKSEVSAYGHLAVFVREAPEEQCHRLWKMIGEIMLKRINNTKPVWLSTAGGGVSWLHVRLDDRPKYYGYEPYRHMT